jgi:CxxC motif-containing protein (DUF1111 family)
MFTGASPLRALRNQPANLFSDLLLHDMGRLGDGSAQGSAQRSAGTRDMRTAPLWSLRVRTVLLHDGRAKSVTDAVLQHDGEAAASRRRLQALSSDEKRQLLAFLKTI